MSKKERADQLVYQLGLAESREKAKRLIMAGLVFLKRGNALERIDKPGQNLAVDAELSLENQERFVSRGAYKLLTAIEHFSFSVEGMTALDAGASTGGFTDCLLQYGARKVYAVDVGKNQLHERLQSDARVINLEGINLRYAAKSLIPEEIDIIVSDVSFISLTLVLPNCMQWLKKGGLVAALIKPQFEVGPGGTVKGVVKDASKREVAVNKVLEFCKSQLGLSLLGVVPSAIKGPKGNQEYMALWEKE